MLNKAYVIHKNPSINFVSMFSKKLKDNEGYCPCKIDKIEDNKCICKEFLSMDSEGYCHCGLYYKKLEEMTLKLRGFEVCKGFENAGVRLPERATSDSAGYDFFCIQDIVIPPIKECYSPVFVDTGVKAYMQKDEVLELYNRSSNPGKRGLILCNSVGIIDQDYYGNPDNDGHIMFQFYNIFDEPVVIRKGDKLGQGIFKKFLVADTGNTDKERKGGIGSTGN